jgi:thiamine monophosphate synthase
MTRRAIGLVHRPSGTPAVDRDWARALVVRHSRDRGLSLLDILEIDDDADRTRAVIRRLADSAASAGAAVFITDGLDDALAESIARDVGLTHESVPRRARPPHLG